MENTSLRTIAFLALCLLRALPAAAAPFAYVPNSDDGTVSVIDTATDTVVATVPVGQAPIGVAVHPAGTYAYVTNRGDGSHLKVRLLPTRKGHLRIRPAQVLVSQ